MLISATYICPVRGLASLEPPEPTRLLQAAKVAWSSRVGLIDQGLEPKEHVGAWLKEIGSGKPKDGIYYFINISKQEYLDTPHAHLPRLWDHFRQTS